jgi:hypothetical protein
MSLVNVDSCISHSVVQMPQQHHILSLLLLLGFQPTRLHRIKFTCLVSAHPTWQQSTCHPTHILMHLLNPSTYVKWIFHFIGQQVSNYLNIIGDLFYRVWTFLPPPCEYLVGELNFGVPHSSRIGTFQFLQSRKFILRLLPLLTNTLPVLSSLRFPKLNRIFCMMASLS